MNQNLKKCLLLKTNYVSYLTGSSMYADVQSALEKCQFLRRRFMGKGAVCVCWGRGAGRGKKPACKNNEISQFSPQSEAMSLQLLLTLATLLSPQSRGHTYRLNGIVSPRKH